MQTNTSTFQWQYIGGIFLLNLFVGVGAYFVAHQFNDGKLNLASYGGMLLAMALPNLILGRVVRFFRHPIAWYFLAAGLLWLTSGLVLVMV